MDIQAHHLEARPRQAQGQGQTDIAQAQDGDAFLWRCPSHAQSLSSGA
jgi:hypothetical protein